MQYFIKNDAILNNLISHINKMRESGKVPYIEIGEKKDTRRNSQNRLMHQWFRDIDSQSGSGIIYESGRCKIQYFLPMMRLSKNQKTLDQIELLEWVYKSKEAYGYQEHGEKGHGYDFLSNLLGSSHMESTSLLSVKEFATALTNMQTGERKNGYFLTNPDKFGWEDWRK